ncbi:hypothetical protein ACIBG8_12400 [Nonomuraea sp. NPDC050556]|uniref:YxiG-like protein n=1 Tax=Nonomuraea sp. NPDC050556 TaxID=3364369 RepID=UPI00379407CD
MDTVALQAALDEIFDFALVFHAYTDYMRDYEALIYIPITPTTTEPVNLRYVFKYCVEAHVSTAVSPKTWQTSLDDSLLGDPEQAVDGFVWGVRWQNLYPGAEIIVDSAKAREWSAALGIDFHEVRITTEAQVLSLVFSDLEVSEVPVGYAPFAVSEG